ncbi:MAG: histidine phosphatase family protein, partial [Verrucomicrobia bacterium]|nr:histidine phosphatase family protein [Verrucomicrobiota bacterium]
NARGERAAPQMARHLHGTVRLKPDYVLSSPALRAISTARIIAPVLGIAEGDIVQNQAIYNADLQTLVYAIREIPNEYANAMLYCNMPGVAELVHFLTGSAPDHYSTCGVAMFELNLDRWADANLSCGKLTTFLFPKMLEGAAS